MFTTARKRRQHLPTIASANAWVRWVFLSLLVLGGVSTAASKTAEASTPSASRAETQSATGSTTASLPHLYWHLLFYQNHLDRRATALEQQSKLEEGRYFRTHLQKELHFSEAQFAIVRESALQLEKELNDVNAKARPVVDEARQWLKVNGRSAGPPPGRDQIHQLRRERDIVIANAVDRLNYALGSTAAAQLQTYVEKSWSSHVTVHQVQTRPHSDHHRPEDLPKARFHLQPRQPQEAQQ